MTRPLSIVLATALAVSSFAVTAVPAVAQDNGAIIKVGDNHHWRGDRWRHHHRRHYSPGFSFGFGVPFPPVRAYYPRHRSRDCFRDWDGALVCRYRGY